MVYNKFKKIEQLRKDFGINDLQMSWLPTSLPNAQVSSILLQSLEDAKDESLVKAVRNFS